jgi:hypothetical protein
MTDLANTPTTYWDDIRRRHLLELQGGLERDERGLAQSPDALNLESYGFRSETS